jgi:hypothetical protein
MTIITNCIQKCEHNIQWINVPTKLSMYCVGRLQCTEETSTHSYHDPNKNNPILQSYFFQTLTLHYPPKSPNWFLLFRFSRIALYSLFLYYMHATCHIMYYVNNIWWRLTDMKLTTESSAHLYSYLPVTSSILLTTLLTQTLNLCSSLDIRHHISHTQNDTKMSIL